MVCSLGGGQMTTLLEGGSTSQIMAEDVGCWKLAAQYIQRELKEADEVNLLDEEDMHVFGLRPMMDPLILVCCDSCKKPLKVSQYATHAEICKSLSSVTDNTTEIIQKKPPRKERKKLQNTISKVSKPQRSELFNSAASNSHVDEQTLKPTSFPIKAKPKGISGVPAPLATKIFYSQRNQRLRAAISHMFYTSSSSSSSSSSCFDHGLNNSDNNNMPLRTSTHAYFHHNKTDDQCEKEKLENHVTCNMENCDQIPAKRSEAISDESRTLLPMNFSDQFHANNHLGPQRIHVGSLTNDSL
ncbi:uncharacterized protein LOC111907106 isoform X2 [Lactuca sativa]|uniref:uncharacterized protein LOC111907106 isoform X2 n=1 Tax=Lactuca sativa TaxID=4236 RepID=UPI000CD9579C|nr:uncharacterized protein LOC111907106 isoform X2 [Lactuca sativa]